MYLKGYVRGWNQSADNKKGPGVQTERKLTRKRAGVTYAKNRKSARNTKRKVNTIMELELMKLKRERKYSHTIQRS